jgi:hypothetical protein
MASVSKRPLHWFHPEFNLRALYENWCRPPDPGVSVRGIWQSEWSLDQTPPGSEAPESFFRGRIPGGFAQTLWVANQRTADWLRARGYPNAHAIGAPAVYLPHPLVERVPGSLLVMVYETERGASAFEQVLNGLPGILQASSARFRQISICLPPLLYRRSTKWIRAVRGAGYQVIPFEEDPFDEFSLRESSRLFASVEYVAGNASGHWMAHAAFRGARVFLLDALQAKVSRAGSSSTPEAVSACESVDPSPWGAGVLGADDRKSPAELARLFGWPVPGVDAADRLEDRRRIFSEEWEAERVCAEITAHGNCEEALGAYSRLARERENILHYTLVLSALCILTGRVLEAVATLEKAAERFPGSAPIWNKLGAAYFQIGKTAQAKSCIERVLQRDPQNPVALLKLGQFLLASGRLEPATGPLRQALAVARQAPAELLWSGAANRLFPERALLVSCSTAPESRVEELLLVRSYRQNLSGEAARVDLDLTLENARGLPEVYNEKLEAAAAAGYEFAVFVHDDVFIEESRLLEKLQEARRRFGFDLIGLAGGVAGGGESPTLWHLMCPKPSQRGSVGHFQIEQTLQTVSAYGHWPAQVTLLDGLFLAVHVPTALAVGWRFNPAFTFHHYDLAASLDAGSRGMTAGVFPLRVVHASGGLKSFDDPAWKESDRIFRQLYMR